MPRIFLPQAWVEQANMEERLQLDSESITAKADGKSYRTTPAVRFIEVQAGDDSAQLLGKVKTEKQLADLGAELAGDSVIHGDTAYRVQPGYAATYTASDNPISVVFQ